MQYRKSNSLLRFESLPCLRGGAWWDGGLVQPIMLITDHCRYMGNILNHTCLTSQVSVKSLSISRSKVKLKAMLILRVTVKSGVSAQVRRGPTRHSDAMAAGKRNVKQFN